jgi:hypothetical protein
MKPEVAALMRARFVTFIFKHCFHYIFPVGFVCGTWVRLRKMSKWLHEGIVQPLAMRLGSFGQNGFSSGSFCRSAVQLGPFRQIEVPAARWDDAQALIGQACS